MKKGITVLFVLFLLSLLVLSNSANSAYGSDISDTREDDLISWQEIQGDCYAPTGNILRYVDEKSFNDGDYTERLTSKETLNSYVFRDRLGKESVYLFSEDVKYIDESGEIIEKDITLVDKGGGFITLKNNVEVFLPESLSRAISISFGDSSVYMCPEKAINVFGEMSENRVIYHNAFGPYTSLVYTPTLSGVKEDIVLQKSIPDASFSFQVIAKGLSLKKDSIGYCFINGDGEIIFRMGKVIAYDSKMHFCEGFQEVRENENGTEVVVSIERSFLDDPATSYPVTIDPVITLSDNINGANSIQDAPVFAGVPNLNCGSYPFDTIGTTTPSYGIGRTAVRLYSLLNSNAYSSITASQVDAVVFYMKDAAGNAGQFINLYPLSNTSWTETAVTWSTIGSYATSLNCGNSLGNNAWTGFNITNLVKAWKNGTYNGNAGFIMVNSNESANKAAISSEYTADVNARPYVVFSYYSNNPNPPDPGITSVSVSGTNHMALYQTQALTSSPAASQLNWTSSNTSVLSVTNGTVYALSEGTATIIATYHNSVTGQDYSGSITITVGNSIGLKNNQSYYLTNKAYNLFLWANSDTENASIYLYTRYERDETQWKLRKLMDGRFQLESGISSTGRCLTMNGTDAKLATNNNASSQIFNIYRCNSGTYKGLYTIRNGIYYLTYTGINVCFTTTCSEGSYWSFETIEKDLAELVSFEYYWPEHGGMFDTTANISIFSEKMSEWSYYVEDLVVNPLPLYSLNQLNNSNLYFYNGHGNPGLLEFHDDDGLVTGGITVNSTVLGQYSYGNGLSWQYIELINENVLADVKAIMLIGCNTGKNITTAYGSYNLVDSLFNRGAHFVLGTTEAVFTNNTTQFIELFLQRSGISHNIQDAVNYARQTMGNVQYYYPNMEDPVYGQFPTYMVGDDIQYICH